MGRNTSNISQESARGFRKTLTWHKFSEAVEWKRRWREAGTPRAGSEVAGRPLPRTLMMLFIRAGKVQKPGGWMSARKVLPTPAGVTWVGMIRPSAGHGGLDRLTPRAPGGAGLWDPSPVQVPPLPAGGPVTLGGGSASLSASVPGLQGEARSRGGSDESVCVEVLKKKKF